MRTKFVLIFVGVLLSACAEKNFVPGSPMAMLFGYNRTYEEIAAEDCEKQFGFSPQEDIHKRCVFELSMSRRQSDDAYMRAMGSLAAQSLVRRNSQGQVSSNGTHTYFVNGRSITCVTSGTITTCN